MTVSNVLVFGATGTQGHPVVDAALEAGLSVRAASRDPDGAAEKLSSRVEIVRCDLDSAEDVAEAMQGMHGVFYHLPILPQSAEAGIQVDQLIRAARGAGIRRLVFSTSAWCGEGMPAIEFVSGLRRISERFLDSGVETVVLRPTLYLANLVWPHIIRQIREDGCLSYPPIDHRRRMNWTSTEDQGAIAVACFNADVAGEVIDIASPEPVTGPELCQMLAGVYGREVHYAPQSIEAFADALSHLAGSAAVGRSIAELYAAIDQLPGDGPLIDTDALEARLGVRLTPVSEWVDDRLGRLLDLYG